MNITKQRTLSEGNFPVSFQLLPHPVPFHAMDNFYTRKLQSGSLSSVGITRSRDGYLSCYGSPPFLPISRIFQHSATTFWWFIWVWQLRSSMKPFCDDNWSQTNRHSTNKRQIKKTLLPLPSRFQDFVSTINSLETISFHSRISLAVDRLVLRQNRGYKTSGHHNF